MNTLDFFLAPQNGPFTVAAVITLIIAIVQFLSLLLGLGVTEALDELMPDLETELEVDADADMDADLDFGEPGMLEQFFGWLNAGRVPMLVLLIVFLSSFAGTGYVAQAFATGFVGLRPSVLVGPLAFAAALPTTRGASRVLGRVLPKDESYAITPEDLVGEIATVTLGPVERETAGKAKVMDAHGNLHFVRVRSARPDASFDIGAEILLVRREGSVFEAITPPAILNA